MKYQIVYSFETEEELRAHLGGGTTRAAAPAPAEEPEVTVDRSALDGDQMPYDAEVHSDPPSFTADGLWRAKRGKKEAADAARAAFKARGAAVVAPVITAPVAPPVAAAIPGIPAAAPVRQAPVTYEALIEKFTEVNARGALDAAKIGEVYARLGITDVAVFETNESMRAAMLAELSKF